MAFTTEQLQAKRDALFSAMTSGRLRVQDGDQSVQYQSVEQMKKALAELDSAIATTNGSPRIRRRLIISGKGL